MQHQFKITIDGKVFIGPAVVASENYIGTQQHRAYFCPITGKVWAVMEKVIIGRDVVVISTYYPYMRSAFSRRPWHGADRPGSLLITKDDLFLLPRPLLLRELFTNLPLETCIELAKGTYRV